MGVRLKRVYEPAEPADGHRVLVDRVWPRGCARTRPGLFAARDEERNNAVVLAELLRERDR